MNTDSRDSINKHYLLKEEQAVTDLLEIVDNNPILSSQISVEARQLVEMVRSKPERLPPLDRFLTEYDLATEEGVLLMCLAETLLRIPDTDTANTLIADKLKVADWEKHTGNKNLLVNASTWGLMLTGRLLPDLDKKQSNPKQLWQNMMSRLSEPVIRKSILLAMRIIGDQFVFGQTINQAIEQAISRAKNKTGSYECYSFDMLGEAALTGESANDYLSSYHDAISTIGKQNTDRYGISVKLSALCPRFEVKQWDRACTALSTNLKSLAIEAKNHNCQLTVDAEESERLELTLSVFENVFNDAELKNWNGLGLAVQAYQKRAIPVIRYCYELAKSQGKIIPLRLVKGAYWDSEIKQAQVQGLDDYPVYTRKCNTDLSYLAAVDCLSKYKKVLYPQFATHNAHTVAFVKHFFKANECEFQRLHGMGEILYESLNRELSTAYTCRVYAPVGSHDTLLPYLVRRLLENGANTSFVHRIADPSIPADKIIADPVSVVKNNKGKHRHPNIRLPQDLFGKDRKNSKGINFSNRNEVNNLLNEIHNTSHQIFKATPIVSDVKSQITPKIINNPANQTECIGRISYANKRLINQAIENASNAWQDWDKTPATTRATILDKAADLFQQRQALFISLCIREAGKTITDAHSELREAIDYCRYYAAECRRLFNSAEPLSGPVGESNELRLRGKGVFFCISPWNFPIAIYTGQIVAALAAGNAVLAKPAGQTSIIAMHVTQLLHEAGIPKNVLGFIPGMGSKIAKLVLNDERLSGVAFTGSNTVAKTIEKTLAKKAGSITTLIAETGGINAMLVDSSALAEQVVQDVVYSAFNSAGQRCSALRVLYLQEEIANNITQLITGRMQELIIGDPAKIKTDIGPVINEEARTQLLDHINLAEKEGRLIHKMSLNSEHEKGLFVPPALIKIEHISDLQNEVFGPVLHIIQFKANQIDNICDEINDSGYGLTFGIHSRISHRVNAISQRMRVGNVYINRNMVGAVVGSQPFGGCGLSGTGPKAGGQHYLQRFATEQTVSTNTAAIGGNASLLSMDE